MQENNPNNEIIDLIIRSLRKELDVEEEKILQDWLEEKTVHREEYNNMSGIIFILDGQRKNRLFIRNKPGIRFSVHWNGKKGWVGIMVWLLLWYCWLPWLSHYC